MGRAPWSGRKAERIVDKVSISKQMYELPVHDWNGEKNVADNWSLMGITKQNTGMKEVARTTSKQQRSEMDMQDKLLKQEKKGLLRAAFSMLRWRKFLAGQWQLLHDLAGYLFTFSVDESRHEKCLKGRVHQKTKITEKHI